jgi:hypothetical protein
MCYSIGSFMYLRLYIEYMVHLCILDYIKYMVHLYILDYIEYMVHLCILGCTLSTWFIYVY